jgi:hypothetical protein
MISKEEMIQEELKIIGSEIETYNRLVINLQIESNYLFFILENDEMSLFFLEQQVNND